VYQEIVDVYNITLKIQNKRKHIQRKSIFSKPVYGYSLNKLSNNNRYKRLKKYTDTTKIIHEISILDEKSVTELHKSGYYSLSDIALTEDYIFDEEVNLPNRAKEELKSMAKSEYNINYLSDDVILENINKNIGIKNLLDSIWSNLLLLEYSLFKWIKNKANKLYIEYKNKSKYSFITEFSENIDKNNVEAISYCTNTSISYIKQIISGRIKYGLTDKERKEILKRDNHKCRYCGDTNNLEIHHVIPVSHGGNKKDDNLCTLCKNCHFNIAHDKNTSDISYDSKNEFWDEIINK